MIWVLFGFLIFVKMYFFVLLYVVEFEVNGVILFLVIIIVFKKISYIEWIIDNLIYGIEIFYWWK